jgi:hypothetical protein
MLRCLFLARQGSDLPSMSVRIRPIRLWARLLYLDSPAAGPLGWAVGPTTIYVLSGLAKIKTLMWYTYLAYRK